MIVSGGRGSPIGENRLTVMRRGKSSRVLFEIGERGFSDIHNWSNLDRRFSESDAMPVDLSER